MMNILVRPAIEADLSTIYDFVCALEDSQFDYTSFAQIFRSNIINSNYYYLVAELQGEGVTGFISCHVQWLLHHCGKVAEIQEFFVKPAHRKAGIGKTLIFELEKVLRQQQCMSFEVTAQNKRQDTHLFYEAAAFKQTHKKFVKVLD